MKTETKEERVSMTGFPVKFHNAFYNSKMDNS